MREFLWRRRQILTFLVVGVLSAVIDVGLMKLLLVQGAPVVTATTVAFVVGLVFNLCCHARFTFASRLDAGTVARYLCVVALNYAITLGCVQGALGVGVDPLWGKLVALFIAPVIGFLCSKYWVFRPRRV